MVLLAGHKNFEKNLALFLSFLETRIRTDPERASGIWVLGGNLVEGIDEKLQRIKGTIREREREKGSRREMKIKSGGRITFGLFGFHSANASFASVSAFFQAPHWRFWLLWPWES